MYYIYLVIYWNVQFGIVLEQTPAVYYHELVIHFIVGTYSLLFVDNLWAYASASVYKEQTPAVYYRELIIKSIIGYALFYE